MKLAFVGGKVIDGNGGAVLHNGTVVIDGSKIVEMSQAREFASGVHVIDVTGKTLMPGLIDCHRHFAPWAQWLISSQEKSLMLLVGQTVYSLRAALEGGCTTARDLGGLEAGFRESVAQGLIPGPRLQTCLCIIQPTNGVLDSLPMGKAITPQGLYAQLPGIPTPWADGPHEVRKKVREVLRYGADVVKIVNNAGASPRLRFGRAVYTQEELAAIVDEAHMAGVQVCCHAISLEAAITAVRAGVDVIEHGIVLDEACVEEMAERGTWLVPTFHVLHWYLDHQPEEARAWARSALQAYQDSFRFAMKAGVSIAMGTDAVYGDAGHAAEVGYLVDAGMTPAQAIQTSTKGAAECMRIQDQVGTLEAGKEADLLVVDGDPLQDVSVLSRKERLELVMKGGKGFSGPLLPQLPRPLTEMPEFQFH